MSSQENPLIPIPMVLLAGMSALAMVMGIGRFAYTPILPLMQAGEGFSETVAGLVASANYGGYFLAALFSAFFSWPGGRTVWLRSHLVLNVLTTGIMGWLSDAVAWGVIRFLSGWSSGVVFVLSSNMVLDRLSVEGRNGWKSGVLYSGVGLGIAFSGFVVPLLASWKGWRGAWWGLMVFSALLIPLIWHGLREVNPPGLRARVVDPVTSVAQTPHRSRPSRYGWLVTAYGLEGLGYIVSGTFLVAVVMSLPTMAPYGAFSWVLVGLAAAPSTVLWSRLAGRWGDLRVLMGAYFLQAAGVIMPILFPHPAMVFLGAVLFGGTFMGITTLAMTVGRRLLERENGRAVGQLTAAYGLGQMIGPAVAGTMATWTGGYALPLAFACLVLLAGACALVPVMDTAGRDRRGNRSMQ